MTRTRIIDAPQHVGREIEVAGWVDIRRNHGKLLFIDVRDETGIIQLVISPKATEIREIAEKLRPEWVIQVIGKISQRPEGMNNPAIPTGGVELQASRIDVLNEAEALPFDIAGDGRDINEEIRLRQRYLDLRRSRLQTNIRVRHSILLAMRNFLNERGFIEIETPILTKSTPEGARDYVVPSRIYDGKFYALPQSPQQYKQLLMIAGFEKYFQIARCFRDEDTRGDRQPEFTQLDIEMSFVSQDDILSLTEDLFTHIVDSVLPRLGIKKRITKRPWFRMTHEEAMKKFNTDKPDLREDTNDPNELAFGFVYDFPMFEKNSDGTWSSAHHPFTMIKDEDIAKLSRGELASIRAFSYDFVLNGYEIASGSIRVHSSSVQKKIFGVLGISEDEIHEKFGHMIAAFTFGAPPHGGIAPGIDRFMMLILNEPNIREVIAFPKTGEGYDPMMGSPSEISPQQLKDLHIHTNTDTRHENKK